MPDLALLKIGVDSSDVPKANQQLDKLDQAAGKAEKAVVGLGTAADKTGQKLEKLNATTAGAGKNVVGLGTGSSKAEAAIGQIGTQSERSASSVSKLGAASGQAETNVTKLGSATDKVAQQTGSAGTAMERWQARVAAARAQQELLNNSQVNTISIMGNLMRTLGGLVGLYAGSQILNMADQFNQLRAKMQNVMPAGQMVSGTLNQIVKISDMVGVSITGAAQAFVRLAPAAQQVGASTQKLLDFEKTFFEMGALAGNTSEEIHNAMIQLSQGLGAGRLQGQDLRAIMDDMPAIARTIAESMKIPFSEFRKQASEGKVTSQEIFKAILDQKDKIQAQFDTLPGSIGRSFTALTNSVFLFIGALNDLMDATGVISKGLREAGDMIEFLRSHLQETLTVVGAVLAIALILSAETIANSKAFIAAAAAVDKYTASLLVNIAAQQGASYAAGNKIFNNIAGAASKLKTYTPPPAMQGAQMEMGGAGMGIFATAKAGQGFDEEYMASIKNAKTFQQTLGDIGKGAMGLVTGGFQALINGLKTLGEWFVKTTETAVGFFSKLLANPLTWIIALIVGVVNGLFQMQARIKETTGITVTFGDIIRAMWEQAGAKLNEFLDMFPGLQQWLHHAEGWIFSVVDSFKAWGDEISRVLGLTGQLSDVEKRAEGYAAQRALNFAKDHYVDAGFKNVQEYRNAAEKATGKKGDAALQAYNDIVSNQVSNKDTKPGATGEDEDKKTKNFIANVVAELKAEQDLLRVRKESETEYADMMLRMEAEKKVREAHLKVSKEQEQSLINMIYLTAKLKATQDAAQGIINTNQPTIDMNKALIASHDQSEYGQSKLQAQLTVAKQIKDLQIDINGKQAQTLRNQSQMNFNQDYLKKAKAAELNEQIAINNAQKSLLAAQRGPGAQKAENLFQDASSYAAGQAKTANPTDKASHIIYDNAYDSRLNENLTKFSQPFVEQSTAIKQSIQDTEDLIAAQNKSVDAAVRMTRELAIQKQIRESGLADLASRLPDGEAKSKVQATLGNLDTSLHAEGAEKQKESLSAITSELSRQLSVQNRLFDAQKQGAVFNMQTGQFEYDALVKQQQLEEINLQIQKEGYTLDSAEGEAIRNKSLQLNAIKKTMDDLKTHQDAVRDSMMAVGQAVSGALEDIILKGQNAIDVMRNLAMSIANILFQQVANQVIGKAVGFAMSAIGLALAPATGGASAVAGLGGGAGVPSLIGALSGHATGGAFINGAPVHAFAMGGITRGPELFPMANGGMGLRGESGAEAVLPLRRMDNGRLGIEAMDTGGGSGTFVHNEVHVHMEGGGGGAAGGNDAQKAAMADMIGKQVKKELVELADSRIHQQQRPGGLLNRGPKM